jgi:PAS domain S-box-containing protein
VLAAQTPDGVFVLATETLQILDANEGAATLTGYTREELIGLNVADLIPRQERRFQLARISAVDGRSSTFGLSSLLGKDGSITPIEVREQRMEDGSIVGIIRPAGARQQAESYLRQMLGGIELLALTLDLQGRIAYANPALAAGGGWSTEELIGRAATEVISLGANLTDQEWSERLTAATLDKPLAAELVTKAGSRYPITLSASSLRDGGRATGMALLGQDVSDEHSSLVALQGQLREREEVSTALGRLQRGETIADTAAAICRELRGLSGVDISCLILFDSQDGATVIAYESNQAIAFAGGTRLPASRATYLMNRARVGPWSEPWQARGEDGAWGEMLAAARVTNASYAPIRHGDDILGLLVVVSIGDADPDPAAEAVRLPMIAEFGAAASALLAKQLWADRTQEDLRRQLLNTIDSHAWHPVFQPIVDLADGEVVGYEALTRFADGEPPDRRFATAWTVGLGWELELATIKAALLASRQLPPGRWLDLNVSPRLLADAGRLRRALRSTTRPLVVEVTEHDVITDYPAARAALAELGHVRTAVDDAGSGTANFAHVIDLKADFIKLDIGLVRGIDRDLGRQAMVVAMRHFGQATGCRLIAEGVETKAEADMVKALGADMGQGFWYARPAAVDDLNAPAPARKRGQRRLAASVRAAVSP